MKKLLSFLMAALLLVGVCTAAVAENNGTLTIQNATIGRTYTIFKVFDATYSGNNISYTYTKTGDTDAFYTALTGSDSPFTLTATVVANVYNVTIKTGLTAEAISAWLTAHKDLLTQYGDAIIATSSTVTFTNLPYGYYYVTANIDNVVVSIDTVTPSVTIIDKNQKPNLDSKLVWNGSQWVPANSLDVGDEVKFQINATLTNYDGEKQIKEYVFTDIMANGFSPVIGGSLKVYVTPQGGSETEITKFTYSLINDQADPNDFTVKIPWATRDEETGVWTSIYAASCAIRIEYSATVLGNAELGANGNKNKVNLSWNYVDGGGDDDPDEPETITYVYSITINKVDANGNTPLAGAEFVLRKGNDTEGYKYLKYTPATEDTPANVEWVDNMDDATVYTTNSNGEAVISGIAEGTYQLVEIKAPEGYNLLSGPVDVTVPTPAEEDQDPNHENVTVTVKNSTGSELPSTGGIGTTIFYIVGGVLMVAAVVLFATKKRMSASKN
ncbi:MAG: SpaH/EbpB family LPXTG-anchored major pilin [Christensenellales bacterium]